MHNNFESETTLTATFLKLIEIYRLVMDKFTQTYTNNEQIDIWKGAHYKICNIVLNPLTEWW